MLDPFVPEPVRAEAATAVLYPLRVYFSTVQAYVLDNPVQESMQPGYQLSTLSVTCENWILAWAGMAILQDVYTLFRKGPLYFLDIGELFDIGAYASAFLFVLPLGGPR